MSELLEITFAELTVPEQGTVLALYDDSGRMPATLAALDKKTKGHLTRAAKAAEFTGKTGQTASILAPANTDLDRVVLVGTGPAKGLRSETDVVMLGGTAFGHVMSTTSTDLHVIAEIAGKALDAGTTADLALGMQLRGYKFERYKTKAGAADDASKARPNSAKTPRHVTILCKGPKAAERQMKARQAIAEGVCIARDLVNEPANTLGPVEFAEQAERLRDLGVKVEVLDDTDMEELGMHALLGVGRGSARPSRIAVMEWQGAKDEEATPLAIIGKGVVFDSGGISLKPAKGMEDMKGDMGGAACVVGLMHTLARRGAKLNAVGLIGLVENMPGANAQRPGDIVTSMSGQTIEVLNTDAEGRLVLADVLWYARERFQPKLMIDLATLTGAVIVALGKEHAGLFSNDDALAEALFAAGQETGEKVWRLPLDKAYDKLIDSKTADMKNIGGPQAGSITAAQFIQRFVGKTPWVHLDVAGTAMAAKSSSINRSWGSGFGVRLLDRLIADGYED